MLASGLLPEKPNRPRESASGLLPEKPPRPRESASGLLPEKPNRPRESASGLLPEKPPRPITESFPSSLATSPSLSLLATFDSDLLP